MLEVTITAATQAVKHLVKYATTVFLWQLLHMVCKATFTSPVVVGFG